MAPSVLQVRTVNTPRLLVCLALLTAAISTASCGGNEKETVSGGGDGGGDGGAPKQLGAACGLSPIEPTGTASCSLPRAVGIPSDGGAVADAGFGCTSDSDCTSGTNGRCVVPGGEIAGQICSYDECITDSDCGPMAACYCGTRDGSGAGANECVASQCTSDADCGAGYTCALSNDFTCGSRGGLEGYFCHSAQDGCLNDCDCPDEGADLCRYDSTAAHWSCASTDIVCSG